MGGDAIEIERLSDFARRKEHPIGRHTVVHTDDIGRTALTRPPANNTVGWAVTRHIGTATLVGNRAGFSSNCTLGFKITQPDEYRQARHYQENCCNQAHCGSPMTGSPGESRRGKSRIDELKRTFY